MVKVAAGLVNAQHRILGHKELLAQIFIVAQCLHAGHGTGQANLSASLADVRATPPAGEEGGKEGVEVQLLIKK